MNAKITICPCLSEIDGWCWEIVYDDNPANYDHGYSPTKELAIIDAQESLQTTDASWDIKEE